MTKEEAAKLALNGYSKDDIIALGFTFSEEDKKTEETTPEDKTTEETTPEDKKPEKNNSGNEALEELTKTVSELSATVKAMQEANLKGARGGKVGNNGQSAADVVKDFIKNM